MHDFGLFLTHRLKREGKETDKYFFKVAEEFLSFCKPTVCELFSFCVPLPNFYVALSIPLSVHDNLILDFNLHLMAKMSLNMVLHIFYSQYIL